MTQPVYIIVVYTAEFRRYFLNYIVPLSEINAKVKQILDKDKNWVRAWDELRDYKSSEDDGCFIDKYKVESDLSNMNLTNYTVVRIMTFIDPEHTM